MRFNGICLSSNRIKDRCAFYIAILQSEPSGDENWWSDFDGLPGSRFTICSAQGMEEMAPDGMSNSGTSGYTIKLEVDDVDVEYERLQTLGVAIVKPRPPSKSIPASTPALTA